MSEAGKRRLLLAVDQDLAVSGRVIAGEVKGARGNSGEAVKPIGQIGYLQRQKVCRKGARGNLSDQKV
jgi:hypothetical protein